MMAISPADHRIVHWDVDLSDPSEILYNTGQDDTIVFERPGNDITG